MITPQSCVGLVLLAPAIFVFPACPAYTQQPALSASINLDDQINSFVPPKTDYKAPRFLLAALQDAQDGLLQQQALYERDVALEAALSHGEHPQIPANYTSSRSRIPLIKECATSLHARTRAIERVLHSPKAANFTAEEKLALETAITHVPAIKIPGK